MRIHRWLIFFLLVGLAVYWVVTRPTRVDADALAGLDEDLSRGETVFYAAGCASCHTDVTAEGEAKLELGGGQEFPSDFGTFLAPNISQSTEHGIGGWTREDFVTAVTQGVSPEGQHYYPAFPYTTYTRMELSDAVALYGFMKTLPAVETPSQPHKVSFPFNIRRNLGGWKFLFLSDDWVLDGDLTPDQERGRYLVEAMGHCAECHTPRNAIGGMDTAQWMGGAPNPSGKGSFPNITPGKLTWSEGDIAAYLDSGFTPEFDSAGGHMALVVENTAQLAPEDRAAIAAYLKAIPPVDG